MAEAVLEMQVDEGTRPSQTNRSPEGIEEEMQVPLDEGLDELEATKKVSKVRILDDEVVEKLEGRELQDESPGLIEVVPVVDEVFEVA